jgi:hypothetical protein
MLSWCSPVCLFCSRTDLLARVREVVGKHPDIMKYETRHAKDEDYKADVMVGGDMLPQSHTRQRCLL